MVFPKSTFILKLQFVPMKIIIPLLKFILVVGNLPKITWSNLFLQITWTYIYMSEGKTSICTINKSFNFTEKVIFNISLKNNFQHFYIQLMGGLRIGRVTKWSPTFSRPCNSINSVMNAKRKSQKFLMHSQGLLKFEHMLHLSPYQFNINNNNYFRRVSVAL